MKLTVLVDNNTTIGRYLVGEPALSFFIEDGGKTLLFDTGMSSIFLQNARRLNIALDKIDYVVISHGHDDHIGGLLYLMNYYKDFEIKNRPKLLIHPKAFINKTCDGQFVGNFLDEKAVGTYFDIIKTAEPYKLTDHITYLGEIKRKYGFETFEPAATIEIDGKTKKDYLEDDTALVYDGKDGLVVISGCAHSGICNIVRQCKKITGKKNIADIVGGLHLLKPSDKKTKGTMSYIKKLELKSMHPCHCTALKYKMMINQFCDIEEIGCGSVLEYV